MRWDSYHCLTVLSKCLSDGLMTFPAKWTRGWHAVGSLPPAIQARSLGSALCSFLGLPDGTLSPQQPALAQSSEHLLKSWVNALSLQSRPSSVPTGLYGIREQGCCV